MSDPLRACGWLWLGWLCYWLIAARRTAAVALPEPRLRRLEHLAGSALIAVLLSFPGRLPPAVAGARWAGLPLTAGGIAFCVWARLHLGRMWSAEVVLKEGHRVIRSGPYGLVRHPIYTGLLLAVLGTALAGGRWTGALAFVLTLVVFDRKRRREEALLAANLGEEYRRYQREVPALVPFPGKPR